MSRTVDCEVVRDLLPLYLDGVCSRSSSMLVEEHLAACPACRSLREEMGMPVEEPSAPDFESGRLLKGVFRHLLAAVMAAAVMAACFVCNMGGAGMGDAAGAGHLAATVLYVLFWGLFTWRTRDAAPLAKMSFAISLISFFSAVQSLFWRLLGEGGFIAGFLSVFASVPMYGLRMFLGWTGLYVVSAAVSLCWLLLSWRNLRELKGRQGAGALGG